MNKELLRNIPKVDEILSEPALQDLAEAIPHRLILDAVREVIEEVRGWLLDGQLSQATEVKADMEPARLAARAAFRLIVREEAGLRPVINATGIILHTNLGRARLSAAAEAAVARVTSTYSTLEYDLVSGRRGSRLERVEALIRDITGAESAMVVNNNAAATMLCLSVVGSGRDVIVSRGELVEIGGSFRIPEIMEQSGARLVEVGTTNKTRINDYESNITEQTGALMKIHTSNYRIVGFTEEATLEELVSLGQERSIPVIYDLGSGLMVPMASLNIDEPTVKESLHTGVDLILFSGDKLLGGPQGGIIAGKKDYVEAMKRHPLARVLRVDKMTIAAMEATFRAYYDEEQAKREIPVLTDSFVSEETLYQKALRLQQMIIDQCPALTCAVEKTINRIGGGSAPMAELAGRAVTVTAKGFSANRLEQTLRQAKLPIIARIVGNKLYFEVRTLRETEFPIIAETLREKAEL